MRGKTKEEYEQLSEKKIADEPETHHATSTLGMESSYQVIVDKISLSLRGMCDLSFSVF